MILFKSKFQSSVTDRLKLILTSPLDNHLFSASVPLTQTSSRWGR